jgi:glycosyltransferase involved in cell wall biosynthesis
VRVTHILPVYFPHGMHLAGGSYRYVYCLARALRAHCEVTLVTFGPRRQEQTVEGMRYLVVPPFPGNPENPVPRSLEFLERSADIIHAHQLRSAVTSLLAGLCRLQRRPLVVTDHGGGGPSLMFRLRLYQLIPHFILNSEFSRGLVPESARGRAVVVKGGVELERFRYRPAPRQRQILQVGRIMPHKGINYLLEAAGTDIPVVVAGNVWHQQYYRDLQQLSQGKQVRFLIGADDETIQREYERSAVTVAPSVYRDWYGGSWPTSELLGLTLLESMAVGTPVVCTAVGAMPEYVRDGVTGFVVPPNDPAALRTRLLTLLADAALNRRMGQAGRDHVEQYAWESVAAHVAAVYREILAGARAGG